MIDPSSDLLNQKLQLVRAKLEWPPIETISVLSGNQDRTPTRSRDHVLVGFGKSDSKFLTIGSELPDLADPHALLHRAYPTITSSPGESHRWDEFDCYVQNPINGVPIESLLSNASSLPQALLAWHQVQSEFSRNLSSSSSEKIAEEWKTWVERFSDSEAWSDQERDRLNTDILPSMQTDLVAANSSPTSRIGNGDFTTSNLLVAPNGHPTLIDFEHAASTHFHFEDNIRFGALSNAFLHQPALSRHFLPQPNSSEIRFHLLKRLWLEAQENSQSYQNRVFPDLKQALWKGALPSHDDESQETETAQLFFDNGGDWTEADSIRRNYFRGQNQLLVFPVRSNSKLLRLDPSSSDLPLQLKNVRIVEHSTDLVGFRPLLNGNNFEFSGDNLDFIAPSHSDPQIHIEIPNGKTAHWLVIELISERRTP